MFHNYKFKKSDVDYQVLTEENVKFLPQYMKDNNLTKMIITSDEDNIGWNSETLPDLKEFDFVEELLIYWTNIKDISNVHDCINLKTLWLDNDDRTKINFSNFKRLEKVISWNRKNLNEVWDIPTLKILTIAGVKTKDFKRGEALRKVEELRILKSNVEDLSLLSEGQNISFLELLGMSKIENLDFLGKMKKLKHLRIEANKVIDFTFVKNLTELESCYLESKKGILTRCAF